MRSKRGGDPSDSPRQIRLPQAPTFDSYGMHAHECGCARCEQGFRPTPRDRDLARRVFEDAQRRRVEEARAAEMSKRDERAAARKAAESDREKSTDDTIRKLAAPVERPATDAELAELRAQYGFRPAKRDRR